MGSKASSLPKGSWEFTLDEPFEYTTIHIQNSNRIPVKLNVLGARIINADKTKTKYHKRVRENSKRIRVPDVDTNAFSGQYSQVKHVIEILVENNKRKFWEEVSLYHVWQDKDYNVSGLTVWVYDFSSVISHIRAHPGLYDEVPSGTLNKIVFKRM